MPAASTANTILIFRTSETSLTDSSSWRTIIASRSRLSTLSQSQLSTTSATRSNTSTLTQRLLHATHSTAYIMSSHVAPLQSDVSNHAALCALLVFRTTSSSTNYILREPNPFLAPHSPSSHRYLHPSRLHYSGCFGRSLLRMTPNYNALQRTRPLRAGSRPREITNPAYFGGRPVRNCGLASGYFSERIARSFTTSSGFSAARFLVSNGSAS